MLKYVYGRTWQYYSCSTVVQKIVARHNQPKLAPSWQLARLVGHRHSKGPNNGGHVANEPMAFCTNGLRILKGRAHRVHANPSRPLVALLVRAKNEIVFVF